MNLIELPTWVWRLLDALDEYEEEHPPLYQMEAGSDIKYVRAECFGAVLSRRKAWPPREARDMAEFRRHVMQEDADE